MSKSRVAIICGGRSSEHQISCISARGVLAAIDTEKFQPILVGITQSGKWVKIDSAADFQTGSDGLPFVPENAPQISLDKLDVDLVFPLLHGAYGEDGTIQGMLEMADLPYVGSGVLASAVAMDKGFAKPIFAASGLQVAPGIAVLVKDWQHNQAAEISKISALGFPLFVKPARSGSSRGTTKVKVAAEIPSAIEAALEHDPKAIVEVAIDGREIECAVLEIDGVANASVLGEIKVHEPHEFYDFEAKYLDGSTTFDVPANLSADLALEISSAAITAFNALSCEGLARVDFFLTRDNQILINELNTMPGFTESSVFPMLWQASGKSYTEIITQLCNSALNRARHVIR